MRTLASMLMLLLVCAAALVHAPPVQADTSDGQMLVQLDELPMDTQVDALASVDLQAAAEADTGRQHGMDANYFDLLDTTTYAHQGGMGRALQCSHPLKFPIADVPMPTARSTLYSR